MQSGTRQTPSTVEDEARRLHRKLRLLGWTLEDCALIAPTTLEINALKREQQTLILVHSYQTPDIVYGVGDFVGDSYSLSRKAADHPARRILFCSVYFMGETAKLLNPDKEVLVPRRAGCSLADSITAEQVAALRIEYPQAAVVCYVNSYAEVKAVSDVCCTSSNAAAVTEAVPQRQVVFIPDRLMGLNLRGMTSKDIVTWSGTCIVHEGFNPDTVADIRRRYPGVKILVHPECAPGVVALADYAGGTAGMLDYVRSSDATVFMLVTECGLTDRFKAEFPEKQIVGTCLLCPYMKQIQLEDLLHTLRHPAAEQFVEIPESIAARARASLHKMFEAERTGRLLLEKRAAPAWQGV